MKDQVIVLTGASSGIGRATALELASGGASLVLTSRDLGALEQLARECNTAGGNAIAIAADVTREEDVEAVGNLALSRFGRIDVWINNAAVALFAKFEEAPPDVYRRVIETNFFGYVHGARVALRQFKRQRRGNLINVISVTAGAPQPYTSAYVASKFALRGWASCLRMELSLEKDHDIHVCSVYPSCIDTPLFQHAANYTGRAAKALDPVLPVTRAAHAIASLIARPRAEIVIGASGRMMMANARMSPRLYEKTMARQIDRNHLQDKHQDATSGNLFVTTGPKAAAGGWREHGTATAKVRKGGWPAVVAGAAVLAAVAMAAARRR
ncbi:MAG TPA: SDR family oxidoreductase [Thermoanaerobaculia bacterium]|nr:SDR family oxidoreductase [Thermoanaerobaculia bacterium]